MIHTFGYPISYKSYGGGFLYHMQDNTVHVGLVMALDYKNPYISPYEEF
jgi:electron-transferring-flavoprotein dehydrogenase